MREREKRERKMRKERQGRWMPRMAAQRQRTKAHTHIHTYKAHTRHTQGTHKAHTHTNTHNHKTGIARPTLMHAISVPSVLNTLSSDRCNPLCRTPCSPLCLWISSLFITYTHHTHRHHRRFIHLCRSHSLFFPPPPARRRLQCHQLELAAVGRRQPLRGLRQGLRGLLPQRPRLLQVRPPLRTWPALGIQ